MVRTEMGRYWKQAKKDGSFAKCGRSKQKKDAKRKYPKCVPLAKATRMSRLAKGESAVQTKESSSTRSGWETY